MKKGLSQILCLWVLLLFGISTFAQTPTIGLRFHNENPFTIKLGHGIWANPLIFLGTSAAIFLTCLFFLKTKKTFHAFLVSIGTALILPSLFFLMHPNPRMTTSNLSGFYNSLPSSWYVTPCLIAGTLTITISSVVVFYLFSPAITKKINGRVEQTPGD